VGKSGSKVAGSMPAQIQAAHTAMYVVAAVSHAPVMCTVRDIHQRICQEPHRFSADSSAPAGTDECMPTPVAIHLRKLHEERCACPASHTTKLLTRKPHAAVFILACTQNSAPCEPGGSKCAICCSAAANILLLLLYDVKFTITWIGPER
jgi:hypothetical protein